MTLASTQFLCFLLIVYAIWRYLLPTDGSRKTFLLVASYLFYATWDLRFLAVLVATTLVQWHVGARIANASSARTRRRWMAASIVFALGLLGYFKYANFFASELAQALEFAGLASIASLSRVVAPVGISFYTFQALTYTIDIYRGVERPARQLRDFALFVAFFGHVTAGPISRARLLMPQLERGHRRIGPLDALAVFLIVRGLVKKIIFADVLAAEFVGPAFATPNGWSPTFLLVSVVAYTFQIYMDVSGYTDLARGAARCFGYDLAINFDRPYLARTVSNFWQRWHVSMSSFFRDYLYFGLGGSRRGNVYVNLMLTFIAIGLWHGAGWNFVLYGALHGGMVCLERWRRQRGATSAAGEAAGGLGVVTGTIVTFMFVALSRILFVESDLASAREFVAAILQSAAQGGAASWRGYATLAVAAALHFVPRDREADLARWLFTRHPALQGAGLAALALLLLALATEQRPFVYFRF